MFPDHVTRLRDFFFKSDQVTSVINFPQLISNMEEWLDAHFHTPPVTDWSSFPGGSGKSATDFCF